MFGAKSWTTMTVLPPRCAVSRRSTIRPSLGVGGVGAAGGGASLPAGKPVAVRLVKGVFRPGVTVFSGRLDDGATRWFYQHHENSARWRKEALTVGVGRVTARLKFQGGWCWL